MKLIVSVLKFVWVVIFILLNTIPPLIASIIGVGILYPTIGLWNIVLCKKISFYFADSVWRLYVILIENWAGSKMHFYGDHIPMRETAIVIMNHKSLLDWSFLFSVAGRRGRLGVIKFFAKKIICYIPGFGWGIRLIDSVFLERNWDKDSNIIGRTFESLKKRNIPFWILSFLEGTRATPEKIIESQIFCESRKLPILKNVLYPRKKGFVATVKGLRDIVDAVYDITFGIKGDKPPGIYDLAFRSLPDVHIHIKRIDISEMPKTDSELSRWCEESWIKKDKLMDYFIENDTFPDPAPVGEWSQPYKHISLDIFGKKR